MTRPATHAVVPPPASPFGFRRRCAWCARELRGWQLNLCRRCKAASADPWAAPPYPHASQWHGEPDAWGEQ